MLEMPFRPEVASTYAEEVDALFFVLVALTVIFTIGVGVFLIALAVYYRRGAVVDRSRPVSHNTPLEIAWSVGPLLLALGVFAWSTKIFARVYGPPANAKEVFVIGKQWMWHLQHANGIRENNELHVAVGEPIKLTMISQDVIHAFFVPEFRLQRQVEPGSYTTMWFTPTRVGKYHLYCNMFCGTQHSEMGGYVYVLSKADYQKWVASGGVHPADAGGITTPNGGLTMAQSGAALFQQYQCISCHSSDKVKIGRGPSLVGIYGKPRQLQNGRTTTADDRYLRNVLYFPDEWALAGWPQGMPTYKGVLTEDQVLQINAYVKSLSAPAGGAAASSEKGINAAGNVPGATTGASPAGGGVAQDTDAGPATGQSTAADTEDQQWRYMYGGEQYK